MAKLFGTNAQPNPITQARITPTGIPGSTFVRPAQRQAGGNASALAQALGGLNTALLNYGDVKHATEEDPQSKANREFIARAQQMTPEQLRAEVTNGTADGIRIREDSLNVQLSERGNDDFRKRWTEFYNTEFDRTSGDADAEYQRMRAEYAERIPTEIARGNFYKLTADHYSAWMQKDTEEKVGYVKQQLNTTIVDGFRNSIDDAVNIHGKTPQEAAAMVFAKSAANRDFLGLSGQEQNETIFAIAAEYAEKGEEDLARALLEGTRNGADGRPVPPLVKIAGYTDKAIRLMDQAGTTRRNEARKNGLTEFVADDALVAQGAFTQAEANKRKGSGLYSDVELSNMVSTSTQHRVTAEAKWQAAQQKRELRYASEQQEDRLYSQAYTAMGRMGGVNAIKDIEVVAPSGEGTRTVTRQAQIDAVINMREDDFKTMQETLIKNGTDEATARRQVNRQRVDWYAGNKLENQTWNNVLNGIAGRASSDTLLQKGEVGAYLKDSAQLYRDLKANNPAYLSTVLSDPKSKEFLEAYDRALTNGRMSEDEALRIAAFTVAQPENIKAKNLMPHDKADALATGTLRGLGVDERSGNYAYVMERIESMSKNGATEKEIKAKLEDDILGTAVPINGSLVFDHRDLPDDFPELMQLEIANRVKLEGGRFGVTDASELSVVADGAQAKWYVVNKRTGYPVGVAPITPQSLESHRDLRRAEQDAAVAKIAAANDVDRASLKAEYDAGVKTEQDRINWWREAAGKRQSLNKTMASGIASKLQQNLDERLARERDLIQTTPAQRAARRNQRVQQEGRANAESLGFKLDAARD